jgi:hypothetical protein
MSFKQAVVQVLSEKPRTKEEVLEAVKRFPVESNSSNPRKYLDVILYGSKNPRFKNQNGVFSVAGR